ncbi:Sodium/hydrogen exchanger family-domain-containing protein [Geranomyces variabilis]|nr:Sodium/hydrogen exchanger family-domain-containing protein [Geranomyces variabilis]KAJ3141778.1 monovalent cation:H+ antiporter, CPA1 (nhx1) [Geranomyces variabilis]
MSLAQQTDSPALPDHGEDEKEEKDAIWATGALLIYVSMLFVILLVSYYLQVKRIRVIHETVVSIVLGLVIGLIVFLTPSGDSLSEMVTFNSKYFFNLLLPPIILNSGYDMKRKNFFRNIGSILTFALVGTVISTVIIGVLVYLAVHLLAFTHIHPGLQLSMLDCIVFGSILSSTDPVTILAIFHQLRVDPKLYAIIFGESILNDSVAIVLFKVLGEYRNKEVTVSNIFGGISSFVAIFTGSVMVGVIIALIGSLMLKHSRLHQFPSLESSIIVLLAYSSYLLSNGVQLSGIVSLLFCGICLKHYGYNNMSIRTRRTTKYMFRVLSQLCENFVFIYLGVTVFTSLKNEVYRPGLIFLTLIICMFARYMSVIPLARLINFVSAKIHRTAGREEIPRNHQLMLWWAGLRGAIAFALSFEVKGETAKVIQTTTLIICIITVILLGGTTNMALQRLEIRTGVGADGGRKGAAAIGASAGVFDVDDDDNDGAGDGGSEDEQDTDSSDGESEDWNDDLPGGHSQESLLFSPTTAGSSRRGSENSSTEALLTRPERGGGGGGGHGDMGDNRHSGVRIDVHSDDYGDPRDVRALWDDDMTHWFISFDNKWLKPLFTRTRWRWGRTVRGGGGSRHYGNPHSSHNGQRGVSPTRQQLLASPARRDVAKGRSSRAFGQADALAPPRGGGGDRRNKFPSAFGRAGASSAGRGGGVGAAEEETFQDVNGNVWTGGTTSSNGAGLRGGRQFSATRLSTGGGGGGSGGPLSSSSTSPLTPTGRAHPLPPQQSDLELRVQGENHHSPLPPQSGLRSSRSNSRSNIFSNIQ